MIVDNVNITQRTRTRENPDRKLNIENGLILWDCLILEKTRPDGPSQSLTILTGHLDKSLVGQEVWMQACFDP